MNLIASGFGRRRMLGRDVLSVSIDRMVKLYEAGHRVVVSVSSGKDSTVCLEIAKIAASMTGRLPVEVMHRDDEIMVPGSFEYLDRVAQQSDVAMQHWYSREPVSYVFSREMPFFWPFDPELQPSQWTRRPPPYAFEEAEELPLFTSPVRYPVERGKKLVAVIGLRAAESPMRMRGVFKTKGYLTRPNSLGVVNARPIYDWTDADVYKAIAEFGWDYNTAYDVLHAVGLPRSRLRVSSFGITWAAIGSYPKMAKAWPTWAEQLAERLPETVEVAKRGVAALTPTHHNGETWEQTFWRECVREAPAWIAERSQFVAAAIQRSHRHHSSDPFPDLTECELCDPNEPRSWKALATLMYAGDPWGSSRLRRVHPSEFRQSPLLWSGRRVGELSAR